MENQIFGTQTLVLAGLIAVWAFWEYREREIRHKKSIMDIRDCVKPMNRSSANWGKVTTTSIMAVILLAADAAMVIFTRKIGLHPTGAVILVAMELGVLVVLLFMMAMRDARILMKG